MGGRSKGEDGGFEIRKTILEHLADLRRLIMKMAAAVLSVFMFCFCFGLRPFEYSGMRLYYPWPDVYNNINTLIFNRIRDALLPSNVMLINVDITDAIFIQFQIGLVLAFMISMPYLVHVVGQFLAPALKGRETRLLKRVSLPATLLFILGCAFSYYWITPWTLHFLYGYVFAMDIAPFLSVTSFVNFVLLFVLAFGIVFELPIIMVGITSLGIVDAAFWARHWRWAAVACFVFGAVITPDGSGITMIMVALPMLGLYGAGYAVSRLVQKRPTAAGSSSKKTRAKRMAPKPAKGEVPEGS